MGGQSEPKKLCLVLSLVYLKFPVSGQVGQHTGNLSALLTSNHRVECKPVPYLPQFQLSISRLLLVRSVFSVL